MWPIVKPGSGSGTCCPITCDQPLAARFAGDRGEYIRKNKKDNVGNRADAIAQERATLMKPTGPLMIEHRLIERMIRILSREAALIEERGEIRTGFVETAMDFIRTYADQTHHGKEEDILFRDLGQKDLSQEDTSLMQELVEEHKRGRQLVQRVLEAKERYDIEPQDRFVSTMRDEIGAIVDFYPQHIEKEDKVFFPASMRYFSKEEQQAMLSECWEFDRKMIHQKYRSVVERFEEP